MSEPDDTEGTWRDPEAVGCGCLLISVALMLAGPIILGIIAIIAAALTGNLDDVNIER